MANIKALESKWLNQNVLLQTTNYYNRVGQITEIKACSKSMYGYEVYIQLDNKEVVTAQKFEGIKRLK